MKRLICPVCQGSKKKLWSSEVCPNCEGSGTMPIEEVSGQMPGETRII
jgi:DnaJ-class molecular chaperone